MLRTVTFFSCTYILTRVVYLVGIGYIPPISILIPYFERAIFVNSIEGSPIIGS